MPETRETLAGRTVLAHRLAAAGINIIEHQRYPGLQQATYFAIGDDKPQTNISLSDNFLSDLPKTKEYQAAVDSYARAVAGRLKCGSPEVFYCRSRIAVRVSIEWPIQPAVANGVLSTFILFNATNQLDGKIAKCSMEVGHAFGHTTFDTLLQTVNSVRVAIDEGLINFYEPDVHQEVFQKANRQQQFAIRSQAEIEEFSAGKAYFLGFFAVEQPTEVWAADPWDAHYLGVTTKELLLAMRVLRARGLFEAGSSYEYVMPADKLLLTQSSTDNGEQSSFETQRSVSLATLPKKEELLADLEKILKRHPVSALLVIDLDHFKNVNDTKGHPAGDACLEQVVRTLASVVGRKGKIYRWGGDEFTVCLPDFSTDEARVTAERIRIQVEAAKPGGEIAVTTSIGVCATDRVESTSVKQILDFADKAMYQSKRSGKNRVTVWPAETTVTPAPPVAKPSKQAVKTQLTQFLKDGRQVQDGLHYSNFDSLRQKQEWEKRVEEYLQTNLDGSYAVRFQNPGHPPTAFPEGINAKMTAPWAETGARMAMLDRFIAELRD
jgi:diguanylate cyclase (GGDEF)-like protein